ncbi:MAG: DNA repair protein RecO [Calditrichaeota bacterium]|nr:DNA repair protein RecO [Calditrichota bacterium]MCB9367968.1 DNA repair protein RecO [Calditrichota bacterium]
MSELVRDAAIVLRVTPYSETSLVLTVFAERHGKIGLMAKGARRKVKNGTVLVPEPGYEMEFVWAHKPARDLQIVREMSLLDAHFGIRSALEPLVMASSCVELVLRTQSDDDPHPEIFAAASKLLRACELPNTARWPVFWKFHVVLLSQLGFALNGKIEDIQSPVKLTGESTAVLRKLIQSDFDVAARLRVSPTAEREITRWLFHYLSSNLHVTVPSRAVEALRWARQTKS